MVRLLVLLLLASLAGGAWAAEVSGTATYRERMALPPNARFEAVIVDAARADASAPVLASATIDNPGQPPIAFTVRYDADTLDPRARYVLRATIAVDGKLWFTTDTAAPVIGGGRNRVDVVLRRAGGAHGLLDTGPAVPPPGLVGGMFRYLADAATFADCRSGAQIPVAMEGGYLDLERAYAAGRSAPGEPLYVTVEGVIELRPGMEGPPRPTLVARRLVAAWRGETCERSRASAALVDTYWRLGVIGGETVAPVETGREASLVLRSGPLSQALARAGCGRTAARYETTPGGGLTFRGLASAATACEPKLEAVGRRFAKVLAATRWYAIEGPTLVLYDARREPLAALQSVALR